MTEPKPTEQYNAPATSVAAKRNGWQLRKETVKAVRAASRSGMEEWRIIAQATIAELNEAWPDLKARRTSKAAIRQAIADECGNGESTIRLWQSLEDKFSEQLDELPPKAILTWCQLRWIPGIAKREGKEVESVFVELLDEAISRRDREGSEEGENILFTCEAVLKHRAKGDKKEPTELDCLAHAQNWIEQCAKRMSNNGYRKHVEATRTIAAMIEDLQAKLAQQKKG